MAEELSLRLKLKRVCLYLWRPLRRFLGLNRTVYVEQMVQDYRRYWEEAARILAAEFEPLASDLWEVRVNGRHTRIKQWMVQLGDPVTNAIASNKALSHEAAKECGVPVPLHGVFRLSQMNDAKKFLADNPGIYVVKPTSGTSSGVGITTHVRTPRQLENAAISASFFADTFLVEQMIFGESCRLLFLGGDFIHAVRRRGVRVTGDGHSSVAKLLLEQGLGEVPFDLTTVMTLESQCLTPSSVPKAGRDVLVRSLPAGEDTNQELCTVYDETITRLIPTALVEEIRPLIYALETRIAGADIVTNNPSVTLRESGGALLEVNPGPGIHHHYHGPDDYGPDSVAVKVLRYLLQP